jgi:hypothetical protein
MHRLPVVEIFTISSLRFSTASINGQHPCHIRKRWLVHSDVHTVGANISVGPRNASAAVNPFQFEARLGLAM